MKVSRMKFILLIIMSVQISISQDRHLILQGQQQSPFKVFKVHNTIYLLCLQPSTKYSMSFRIFDGTHSFLCVFIRFVNLLFKNRLTTLITRIGSKLGKLNQWPALYEILSYEPKNMIAYQLNNISYGQSVMIQTTQTDPKFEERLVSNCFNLNDDYFYFIEKQHQPIKEQQLGTITCQHKSSIYGLLLVLNSIVICIPFNVILNLQKTSFHILPQIENILKKTVYLQINGTYSTGTLISKNLILTVQHAFSQSPPSIGSLMNVKIYPYKNTQKAKLLITSRAGIDAALLQLIDNNQFLTVSQINSEEYLQNKLQIASVHQKAKIGQKIRALGFGKYNYSFHNFNWIDFVLPTITAGIISKTLSIQFNQVMFKTDASLYNGFSGCAIWAEAIQIGMAVFCIKNTNTSSHLAKQNFSYVTSFILASLVSQFKETNSNKQLQNLIKNVDQFNQRKEMMMKSKL